MNYPLNQHVYYLPYVRFTQAFKSFAGYSFEPGAELPIAQDVCVVLPHEDEVHVMHHADNGCNIFPVLKENVQLFVKIVKPLFKVGDVLIDSRFSVEDKNTVSAFRVYEYTIIQGKVWYRNGWGVAVGCESGRYEDHLRMANSLEAMSWAVEYNDNLVKEKYPTRYNCTIK